MAVLITWGMGEVGFTVEADNAKEALKVYRGITERTENVAEDRVRQIVNEQTVSVHVDHDSPWSIQNRQDNPTMTIKSDGTVTINDEPITLHNIGQVTAPDRPWIDWVYTDEVPIPTELTTGDLIDVVYRDGTKRYCIPHMVTIDGGEATAPYWKDEGSPYDIVKYRRVV